jgi:hypothetical protein
MKLTTDTSRRDRDHKDDDRENGTNGDHSKGDFSLPVRASRMDVDARTAPLESPAPAHDELDTAE